MYILYLFLLNLELPLMLLQLLDLIPYLSTALVLLYLGLQPLQAVVVLGYLAFN